jgi:proliferating cell nuclear antigen
MSLLNLHAFIAQDRISEYEIKLMDIDQEALGIPETEYDAKITMLSSEFARICRDLQQLGESVRIDVSKEGVRFISEGDAANGSILLRPAGDKVRSMAEFDDTRKIKKDKIKVEDEEDAQMADENEEEDDVVVKGEEEEEGDNDEEDESSSKKRKRSKKEEPKRKTKKAKKDDDDEDEGVIIAMSQHVSLTFSLKYLANFSKSGSLSNRVSLSMSNEVPLLVSRSPFPTPRDRFLIYRQVSYHFGQGKIEYYLAPKIGDE